MDGIVKKRNKHHRHSEKRHSEEEDDDGKLKVSLNIDIENLKSNKDQLDESTKHLTATRGTRENLRYGSVDVVAAPAGEGTLRENLISHQDQNALDPNMNDEVLQMNRYSTINPQDD